jgi:hypothetical protein
MNLCPLPPDCHGQLPCVEFNGTRRNGTGTVSAGKNLQSGAVPWFFGCLLSVFNPCPAYWSYHRLFTRRVAGVTGGGVG